MRDLIQRSPENAERIFPYIGGEELNSSPTFTPQRHVINFGEMPLEEASRWPDLLSIVSEKVRPERQKKSQELVKFPWWQFWRVRNDLYDTIRSMDRVLVNSAQAYVHLALAFQPPDRIFAHSLVVFAFSEYSRFGVMQCRVHELWARFFSGTAMDLSRYNPSDCFLTFPFPAHCDANLGIAAIGEEYYDFRSALMVTRNCGLTDIYNRFHDPDEQSADIVKLRQLHAAMDRAVLDAYSWTDIPTDCQFLLDYEEDEDDDADTTLSPKRGKGKKKPWRYRWPDEIRDEVLARLLALNAERAKEELASQKTRKPPAKRKVRNAAKYETELFGNHGE